MHLTLPVWSKYLFFTALLGLLLTSCNKFEGDQMVPSYLSIDTIKFTSDNLTQGSSTHKITDSWVYVNDQLVGVYELPARIPVLQHGIQNLEVRAGIKLNGISSTRVPYPFYVPYTIDNFEFIEDSIRLVNPSTKYYSTTFFAWIEDFENASLSLISTSHSDTNIYKTEPRNNPEALLSEFSAYSGKITLDQSHKAFELASFKSYVLPRNGVPVFLELDYKCDIPFTVGMYASENGTVVSIPLVVVNTSKNWNKIYINLGPNVAEHTQASDYRIFFQSDIDTEEQANVLFDNIKLVYRINE
ncbi:MAG: hypothetical protein HOO86_09080 [Bacteroidales bacterium]|nr:hypothetical protein [Bacteroidales bacterium]